MSECLKHQETDKECMEYAIISHNIDFITFLMNEYGISIDLYACANYNNLDSFLVFYDQSNNLISCLISSPMFNITSLDKYFLSLGVYVNKKLLDGKTALHIAALYNNKETAELLISHSIYINEKDKDRETALHNKAAISNSKETAELLISNGANIYEKDKRGRTALHIAVENNRKETVKLLLSHGANINTKDKVGKTALHYATWNNYKEIAELLILHGAKNKCFNI
ncbi:ankyrin repeat protein, putative [Trichomonas vaginalis G3]|uniref:Ankyrin repeat protein, putative n=1 Tax=Trichomonas vaginalis (strain ATCC PRA-98 / G3) TaxID=412133 RepID=A2FEJ2_TRIV3|nr:protein ubiquitination [Trichomonas vaginalis G3]EAX96674.1 ankyrin repeat protein, putative [Trichomonas vaginalis G3]KAI5501841.1 protein ubiquitination [Trichomonas vaginalis G3]|eukprot:XP_001309604.1 ankyrin repeat protein [Trichomonas vaginalis G3]